MKITKTDIKSVSSVNNEKIINIELKNSIKNIVHTNVVDKINAMSIFENERLNCNKYRLFFTIKPYCSNVLFNPFTEIVKWDKNTFKIILDEENDNSDTTNSSDRRIFRIQNTINTDSMEYYPGYDMFNNHILRSQTFKIVQNKKPKQQFYNTLNDLMYDNKCRAIKSYKRTWSSINLFKAIEIDKHLYDIDDILSFNDGSAINERLIEEDGWFGFENTCRVKTRINGIDQNINKIINYKNGGDFIDMYPDRTLFSFNPKVNKNLHRLEYNWHYVLTYPFASNKIHPFCKCTINGEDTTALKLSSFRKTKNPYGGDIFEFKTFTKHNLQRGDNVRLLIDSNGDDDYDVVSTNIYVSNLGDSKGDDKEHYFITENMDILKNINIIVNCGGSEYDDDGHNNNNDKDGWMYDSKGLFKDDAINEVLQEYSFMINRVYGGVCSDYYFRIFKKIPNFKLKTQELTPEIAIDLEKYNDYCKNNAKVDFNFENSSLGFASSIYTDKATQLIFTDDIDLTNITDNLGRPLTTIYLSIIKNNKGNELWYNRNKWESSNNYYSFKDSSSIKDIEYSHCFGNVSCGIEFGQGDNQEKRAKNGDIRFLNELGCYDSQKIGDYINKDGLKLSIMSNNSGHKFVVDGSEDGYIDFDNLFYGDFVEYNANEAIEKVLDECQHRFNTYQREMNNNTDSVYSPLYKKLIGWDITGDDYDLNKNVDNETQSQYGSVIEENNDGNFVIMSKNYANNDYVCGNKILKAYQKPEGYFYKCHYKIPVQEFGALIQESHTDMEVRRAQPVQYNGIYISITTKLKHGCVNGDKVFICDDENNLWYYTNVVYVVDKLTFYINYTLTPCYNEKDAKEISSWLTTAQYLNEKKYKIRRENINIPCYAQRVNNNQFLWRKILHNGDIKTENLPEYPYTNDAFYINTDINFYLKRQDPHGENGLFTGDNVESFPQDIKGNFQEQSNYEYKDETQIQC